MDLSALIFVALAVAWAVYLIPKALRHHEEDALSRSVDSFSDRMRVLARREAVSAAKAELVVPSRKPKATEEPEPAPVAEPADEPAVATAEPTPAAAPAPPTPLQARLRRAKAARAAARRRRVLGSILVLNLVVVALASASVLAWAWAVLPAALLVGWLVACRLMVKKERAEAPAAVVRKRRRTLADEAIAEEDSAAEELSDETSEVAAVAEVPEEPTPGGWDPVPMTLPTYVAKAPAGRTVRTIDLDSTGVWSSGRNAADSQLAREAEAVAERPADGSAAARRASGA
ncbi:divisome protein SepX/GlpR [Nocardioides panacisoli]|uniref:Uncharacterized protein n=1 Tax=Nocardioides panacisoli TaxID=627624 RepID=A0ABP7IAJ4_9ACTN